MCDKEISKFLIREKHLGPSLKFQAPRFARPLSIQMQPYGLVVYYIFNESDIDDLVELKFRMVNTGESLRPIQIVSPDSEKYVGSVIYDGSVRHFFWVS
jgi:hypothetical protein